MRTSLTPLALVLATAPLFQSCIVAAAAGAGAVAGTAMMEDNTFVSHLNTDSQRTWVQTKATLSRKSSKPIEVDENRRTATADFEGTVVTVSVETYDLNVSILKVSAKKYGFPDNDIAKIMLDRITEDLNKNASR
ncbi:MAG: DUF3568 family protein [Planctomycetota bacterium]|nr:DUF3568 family protein [Planctomycetota bacterium]